MLSTVNRWTFITAVLIVASGVSAQNLLVNPSFEDDTNPSNDIPDGWTPAGDMVYQGAGWFFGAGPRTGTKMVGAASNSAINTGTITQSVGLPNGPSFYDLTLTFHAWMFDNSTGGPSSVKGEILIDGATVAMTTVTNLDQDVLDYATNGPQIATWSGNANQSIAVRITTVGNGQCGGDCWGVAVADDIELINDGTSCGTQHTITDITPTSHPGTSDTIGAVITGTNLNLVNSPNGVQLRQGATTLTGTITAQPGNGLSLTVNFPTTDAPSGFYHLDAQQAGCDGVRVQNAFEVTCPDPSTMTGPVSPNSFDVVPLLGVETITMNGTNLDEISEVRLESSTTTIVGSIQTSSPTQLTVDFDLSDVPPGAYDVIGVRADECPDTLVAAGVQINFVGSNLLLNPSFEVNPASASDNGVHWSGFYDVYGCPNAPANCEGGYGQILHLNSPVTQDGTQAWATSHGAPELISRTVYQSVPVSPGSEVFLTGYVRTGPAADGEQNDATIKLWDGLAGTGTELSSAFADETTANPDWHEFAISGTASSGLVTVEVTVELFAPFTFAAVVHLDDFQLAASPLCTSPEPVLDGGTPVTPDSGSNTATLVGATIAGTDLDEATGVRLISVPDQKVIEGSITNTTPTALTVNFPLTGEDVGVYNVLVDKDNCTSSVGVDEFTVLCGNATTLTSIVPSSLQAPQGLQQLRISGTNLDLLAGVSLLFDTGTSPIPGSSLTMDGSDLLATFDLSTTPSGAAVLQGDRPDSCTNPQILCEAFTMDPLKDGPNLLTNGSWEDGTNGWLPGDNPLPPVHQCCPFGLQVHEGEDAIGRVASGGNQLHEARQAVSVPCGAREYDVTFSFWGLISNGDPDGSFAESTLEGQLWIDGVMVDSVQLSSNDQDTETNPFLGTECMRQFFTRYTGQVNTEIEVRVLIEADGRVAATFPTPFFGVVSADDMVLTAPCVGCNAPFADVYPATDINGDDRPDGDGFVDQRDFSVLQLCATGTVMPPELPFPCECLDTNEDGRINEADVLDFRACAGGPTVPADPNCAP